MRVIKVEKAPKPETPPPTKVTIEFTEQEIRHVRLCLGRSSESNGYPLYSAIADLVDDLD